MNDEDSNFVEHLPALAIRLDDMPAHQKPPYVTAVEDHKAGADVMYCTNAVSMRRAVPYLAVVRIPDRLTVRSA